MLTFNTFTIPDVNLSVLFQLDNFTGHIQSRVNWAMIYIYIYKVGERSQALTRQAIPSNIFLKDGEE